MGKTCKAKNMTRLAGFWVEDSLVKTADVVSKDIRKWCTYRKVTSARSSKKKEMCEQIVVAHIRFKERLTSGAVVVNDEGGTSRLVINNKRFMNVWFGEAMKGKMRTRGRALTPAQLNNGEKAHQAYCEAFIEQFNRMGVAEYDGHNHEEVDWPTDASLFQQIPATAWPKVDKKWNDICKTYEACIRRWTRSGYHGTYEDAHENAEPDEDQSMIYFHLSMRRVKDCLSCVLRKLPSDSFSESGAPLPRNGSNDGDPGYGRGKGKTPNPKYAESAFESISHKNVSLQNEANISAQSTLLNDKRAEIREKDRLMTEFAKGCEGGKAEARLRVKALKAKLARNDEEDEDSEDDQPDSQESLIERIIEHDETINNIRGQIKAVGGFIQKNIRGSR